MKFLKANLFLASWHVVPRPEGNVVGDHEGGVEGQRQNRPNIYHHKI
jgi:hypothetical protein